MLVREIMTAPGIRVQQDADIDVAIQLLAEKRVTSLPVVDDGQHLVGMVSEIDVLRHAVQPHTPAESTSIEQTDLPGTIADLMSREVVTTTEGADVADVIKVFTSTAYKCLPVVRGSQLIGVISRSDVIGALYRDDDDLQGEIIGSLHDFGRTDWQVVVHRGVVEVRGVESARDRDVAAAIVRSVLGVRRVLVPGVEPAADVTKKD